MPDKPRRTVTHYIECGGTGNECGFRSIVNPLHRSIDLALPLDGSPSVMIMAYAEGSEANPTEGYSLIRIATIKGVYEPASASVPFEVRIFAFVGQVST